MPPRERVEVDEAVLNVQPMTRAEAEQYIRNMGAVTGELETGRDEINDVAGRNGKLYEGVDPEIRAQYGAIDLEAPDDFDDDLISAITLGAAYSKDLIKDGESSKPLGFVPHPDVKYAFQKMFILDGVMDKHEIARATSYPPILLNARRLAKKAIDDYKKGDPTLVNQYVGNYVRYNILRGRYEAPYAQLKQGFRKEVYDHPENYAFHYSEKLMLDGRFSMASDEVTRIDLERFKEQMKGAKAGKEYNKQKYKLMTDASEPDSEERRAEIDNLLMKGLISSIAVFEEKRRINETANECDRFIDDFLQIEDEEEKLLLKNESQKNQEYLITILAKHELTDMEALAGKRNGEATLRSLYMDKLRQTELYRTLVSTKQEDFPSVLQALDRKITEKSFTILPEVQLPDHASRLNNSSSNVEDNKKERASFHKVMVNSLQKRLENATIGKYSQKYGISSKSGEQTGRAAALIGNMYEMIDDVDRSYIKSSPNFRKMKTELERLKNYTANLAKRNRAMTDAEMAEINRRMDLVDRASAKYLDEKTTISSDYARDRFTAVFQMRRRLHGLSASIRAIKELELTPDERKVGSLFNAAKEEADIYYDIAEVKRAAVNPKPENDPFKQGKMKGLDLPRIGRYTVGRTAGKSLAVFLMAAEKKEDGKPKYSIDDLTDPRKFRKEKSDMYDHVMQLISENTPQSKRALAEGIYYGRQALVSMQNEYTKKIDWMKPGLEMTDKYHKLMVLSNWMFDVEQEQTHVQNEIGNILQETNSEYKNFNDYMMKYSLGTSGLTAHMNTARKRIREGNAEIKENGDLERVSHTDYMGNLFTEWCCRKMLKDAQASGIAFSDVLKGTEYYNLAGACFNAGQKYLNSLSNDEFKLILPKLVNGEFFKNIQVEYNPNEQNLGEAIKVSGLPTGEQIRMDFKYQICKSDSLDRAENMALGTLEDKEETASEAASGYINRAKEAIQGLKTSLTNGDIQKKAMPAESRDRMKAILAEKLVSDFEKAGLSGEKLDRVLNDTIERLPEFRKLTSYIGPGTVGEFAFNGGADKLVDQIRPRLASEIRKGKEADTYTEKSKLALNNLRNANYTSANQLIRDAAVAYTGQVFSTFHKLPMKPDADRPYTFSEYQSFISRQPQFLQQIRNANGDGLSRIARGLADNLNNPLKLKKMQKNMAPAQVQAEPQAGNRAGRREAHVNGVPGRH